MMRNLRHHFFFLCLLIAPLADAKEAQVRWRERCRVTAPEGNLYFTHEWKAETGLRLRFAPNEGDAEAVVIISPASYEFHIPENTGLPESLRRKPQLRRKAIPDSNGPHEITLKIRSHNWTLFVDNQCLLTLPSPFPGPLTVSQPRADIPADEDAFFQKTAPFAFKDDFLVPEGESGILSAWNKQLGTWELHTAYDNAVERENIRRGASKHPEPSRSPNFYSLRGTGTPGVITAGHAFHDSYRVETALLTQPGEAGLVFFATEDGPLHGFTISLAEDTPEALFRLWKSDTMDCRKRFVQGAATADVPMGQWVKLKVIARDNRVRCFMDHTLVFDKQISLPPGGVYGLFANADTAVRFDDFAAGTFQDLDLRSLDSLHSYVRAASGAFAGEKAKRRWFGRKHRPQLTLSMPYDHPEGTLIIGSPTHTPHWFKTEFTPLEETFSVGVICGYQDAASPFYRWVYQRAAGKEKFRLERCEAGQPVAVLDSFEVPAGEKGSHRIALAGDATEDGILKLYRDGELVLGTRVEGNRGQASGVWVDANAKVAFVGFDYRFNPPTVFRNKFEKNRIFATDPFMRHWSSPEGEWITLPDKTTWFKGDFFGRFALHMPFKNKTTIHLAVREGETAGELKLATENNQLKLFSMGSDRQPRLLATMPAAEMVPSLQNEETNAPAVKVYTVEAEGHLLHISSGETLLAKHYLDTPLNGRRIRIEGFSTEDLMHSHVERYHVKDFLFTESLHNWILNGGSWEIVNRFQCQPRWSHMNGESAHGLAALWSKYEFQGDFCLEMYAGMRHGWYERAGDLNLTIMNQRATPSEGYTITTTGWDPDHSQMWTKFYRNGAELARSSKYLVPRARENNVRRGYNPLLSSGRPIHGAWYYLKLRRVGSVMQYFFDNELVFSVKDSDPIPSGGLGIWTFMNSMMVARVKCAAEQIRPKQMPVREVPLAYQLSSTRGTIAEPISFADPHGQQLPLTVPGSWSVQDEIGQAAMHWYTDTDGSPYMTVETRLGGGQFFAACDTPPAPGTRVAGWLMQVKRTQGARFNFHYTLGTKTDNGQYLPFKHIFHQISGSPEETDGYLLGGQTEVPGIDALGRDWHEKGDWTPVIVWIDENVEAGSQIAGNWFARPVGFGNRQPSYVAQGLAGNAPGDAYAVKNMVPIWYGKPAAARQTGGPAMTGFTVYNQQGKVAGTGQLLAEINPLLEEKTGLNRFYLAAADESGKTCSLPIWWIALPQAPRVAFAWDPKAGGNILVKSQGNFPDYRFLRSGKATVNGLDLPLRQSGINQLTGILPKNKAIHTGTPLRLAFTSGSSSVEKTLDWEQAPVYPAPILLGIKGTPAMVTSFDSRSWPAGLVPDHNRMSIQKEPADSGSFLRIANPGNPLRLQASFQEQVDLTRHPLFQFNYRADDMANVTLDLGPRMQARLAEENYPAKPVRLADALLGKDRQWHAWLGMVSDAVAGGSIGQTVFQAQRVQFRSFGKLDQTGRYSTLDLDNLVFGPAISKADQLKLTPDYYDPAGIDQVMVCIYSGKTPYGNLPEKEQQALVWQTTRPGTEIALPQLPAEGVAHMLLKARNTRGIESDVFDVPFLVDTQAPRVKAGFEKSDAPTSNGQLLEVTLNLDEGAPVEPGRLAYAWNGQEQKLSANTAELIHHGKISQFNINWPLLARKYLDQAENGDVNRITISGIQDGAGNTHPDVTLAVTTDYDLDKQGPTLLPTEMPAAILWAGDWLSPVDPSAGLQAEKRNSIAVETPFGKPNFVEVRNIREDLQVWKAFARNDWLVSKHPYFSFNIRRPAFRKNDKVRVELFVSFNQKEYYVFPLDSKRSGSLDMTLGRAFEWDNKQWVGGVVDVYALMTETLARQMLRDAGKESTATDAEKAAFQAKAHERLSKQGIRMVGFRIPNAPRGDRLQIKDMCISRAYQPEDTFRVEAYDVSGMGGITVAAGDIEKAFDTMTLVPAKAPKSEWISIRPRDKAGNLGPEILLPGNQ